MILPRLPYHYKVSIFCTVTVQYNKIKCLDNLRRSPQTALRIKAGEVTHELANILVYAIH